MKNDIWAQTRPGTLGESNEPPERSPLLDAKVMMVDDEPLMTDLIQALLEDEGYANFVVANDPRQALELLRREEPGVLLLDLMMPQMSGFELLEAIRADKELRYTPVIVLTAATGAESKLRALQLGATDFLSKPVDASELVLRVRNTLAFRQYHSRLLNYDRATGLPTEKLFDRGVERMVENRDLVGGVVALFSVVVPECREIRENMNQAAADDLAKVLAHRLTRFAEADHFTSPSSTSFDVAPRVARVDSEHFAVVFEGLQDADAADDVARHILALVSEPVSLGLHDVVPTAWIGLALVPGDGLTAAALHKGADLAATHARQSGAAHYMFASPALNAKSLQRLTLGSQLRGAAQRGELVLHYQPKVDIASGRIQGVEALVRWQHPDQGLLAPGKFIPLAEELGLIDGIGQWVMARACQDVARWSKAGLADVQIAVNVAKPQFMLGDLSATLGQILRDSGLAASRVIVELTESMLMDDLTIGQANMIELKALGVKLSIDDFGTGYSSLSYLKRFPLDELKIDKSFVDDLPGTHADLAIVRAIIDLGHRLGLSVIAEGVESRHQLECLNHIGCDSFQGFWFSRPLPENELLELFMRENTRLKALELNRPAGGSGFRHLR